MKKLLQTRFHNPPEQNGNCFPTVIACFMDLESAEDAFQVQELYHTDDYMTPFLDWINSRGWDLCHTEGHLYDGSYYLVSGNTERDTYHICIYKNGKLWHDPHPSQAGLVNEKEFEIMEKL